MYWEHGDLYTVDSNGFVTQRGSDSITSDLGQDDFDLGHCAQLAGRMVVDRYHLLAAQEYVLLCDWLTGIQVTLS